MMSKYLMTFKPADTFFFGQENKYRKKKDSDSFEAEYYQVSSYFPQQTTVLGMLRYFVLQQNNQIPISNKADAKKLIGKSSFNLTETALDFGKIKSLSPVFIIHINKKYMPNPLDLILISEDECDPKGGKKVKQLIYEKKDLKTNLPNQESQILHFPEYNEKEGLSRFLLNMKDQEDYLVYDKEEDEKKYVFAKVEKIGITKKQDEKAYYKQVLYKFKDTDTSFACIGELDMNLDTSKKYKAFLGAEKSLFEIEFKEYNDEFNNLVVLYEFNQPKVVLLSDAFIEQDKFNYIFSISKTKSFRFLKSDIKDTNSFGKFNEKGGLTQSDRFNLHQRGSVFYFKDDVSLNGFTDRLRNGNKEKNFYKIGYNYFKTI
ncbi:MAG TPA: hypothetical protein ENI76_00545 [Ignavibacteria bacterium]|nr:hypothetical protein [Ignavibacteria bacterium]